MNRILDGWIAVAFLGTSPAFANSAQNLAHRNAMQALRQECAAKTGAQFNASTRHWKGPAAVMAAFKACIGG